MLLERGFLMWKLFETGYNRFADFLVATRSKTCRIIVVIDDIKTKIIAFWLMDSAPAVVGGNNKLMIYHTCFAFHIDTYACHMELCKTWVALAYS